MPMGKLVYALALTRAPLIPVTGSYAQEQQVGQTFGSPDSVENTIAGSTGNSIRTKRDMADRTA